MEREIIFRLKEGVTLTEEADGALLVDPKTEKTAVVNLVGSVLLKICDGKLSREKMVKVLREKYPEKTVRAIEADVARLLVQLSNFIEPDNIPDGASKNILAYVCAPPSAVGFMITNACNLRCKHCSAAAAKPLEDELSTDEWRRVVKDLAEIGVSAVALTGGEPFLREDIFDVIEKIMECSMGLQINTNATLMTEEVAKKLSTLPRPPSIIVGLDGASAETHDLLRGEGTFDKAIRGLKILQKYGLHFKVFTVVTRYNCHELEEVLKLAKQVGAYQMDITFVVGTGRAPCYAPDFYFPKEERASILEEVESLSHKYPSFVGGACLQQAQRVRAFREGVDMYYPRSGKLFSCGAAITGCTIQPDGTVIPCDMSEAIKAGNIRENSFWHVWQSSEVLREIRSFRGMDLDEVEVCRTCDYRNICIGTCPAAAYGETKVWPSGSPFCVVPLKEV